MPVSHRSFRRRGRPSHQRRRTQWVDNAADSGGPPGINTGAFQNFDLLGSYRPMQGAQTTGITIMRVHLRLWVINPVTNGDSFAIGLGVDDMGEVQPAAAIGAPTNWNPVDQPYLSWMVYQRFAAFPNYSFSNNSANLEFDVRSKRRVPFGDTLLLSLSNIDGATGIEFEWHSRVLIALS